MSEMQPVQLRVSFGPRQLVEFRLGNALGSETVVVSQNQVPTVDFRVSGQPGARGPVGPASANDSVPSPSTILDFIAALDAALT